MIGKSNKDLIIGTWNLNGFNSKDFGNKLENIDFLNGIKNVDIIGITETHASKEHFLSIPGYSNPFMSSRKLSDKNNKASGGLAVFVKDYLIDSKLVCHIPTNNKNAIWIKLKKELFQEQEDIYLGTCYFSPENYEKKTKSNYIDDLESEIFNFSLKGKVLLQGDYNARCGSLQDSVLLNKTFDRPNDITNLQTSSWSDIPYRNSNETQCNSRGKKLIDMCIMSDMHIVNGRKVGDLFGHKTCFRWNGSSQIDLILCSSGLFDNISYLKVGELLPWLTDHCPVFFKLNVNKTCKEENKINLKNAPDKMIWDTESKLKYKEVLQSPQFAEKLDKFTCQIEATSVNTSVNRLNQLLLGAAKEADVITKRNKSKHPKNHQNKPWFDSDCKISKQNLKNLAKKVRQNTQDTELRQKLNSDKKTFKKLVKSKEIQFKNSIITKMNSNFSNPKEFWNLLGKLTGRNSNKDSIYIKSISPNKWTQYFKNLLHTDGEKEDHTDVTEVDSQNSINTASNLILSSSVNVKEVLCAIQKLKMGKATGLDKISNEMLVTIASIYPETLSKLFSKILISSEFPKDWITGMIMPIHKKGYKTSACNYRGIMLLSCLGKLFTSILNQRLLDFAKENDTLSQEQIGFLKGNRTSDNLIILHTLIHEKLNAGKKLFACFVDFEKAFDRVPRNLLIKKLYNCGIKGNFLNLFKNMYKNDQACIKLGEKITDTFPINIGVKQGDNPSPTLFNLFIHDLPESFSKQENDPPCLADGTAVGSLLWADDLIILSETENGLKNGLANLESYCNKNQLNINIIKTKYMVFNREGRTLKRNFKYMNKDIEYVRSFMYLGFCINTTGTMNDGLNDLLKRGKKAFYHLKNQLGHTFYKNPALTIKLFDSLVKPILLYCSDFWGCFNIASTIKNPVEKLNTTLCKYILGVKRQTSNIACKLELGRYPLHLDAIKSSIKNWYRINNETENKLLKTINNHYYEDSPWNLGIKNTLFKHGFGFMWLQRYFDKTYLISQLNKLQVRLKDCITQDYFSLIETQSKLRTYRKFKHDFKMEDYILNLPFNQRQIVAKLRLSDHNLEIERGRYYKPSLDKKDRRCPFCPSKIEDEYHYIAECRFYEDERFKLKSVLFNQMEHLYDDHTIKTKLFSTLFSFDINYKKEISQFLKSIDEKRSEAIELTDTLIIPIWFFM